MSSTVDGVVQVRVIDTTTMMDALSAQYLHAPAAIQTLFHVKKITEIHIGCSSTTVYQILDNDYALYLKIHPRSPHFSFSHEVSILHWLTEQLLCLCLLFQLSAQAILLFSQFWGEGFAKIIGFKEGANLHFAVLKGTAFDPVNRF